MWAPRPPTARRRLPPVSRKRASSWERRPICRPNKSRDARLTIAPISFLLAVILHTLATGRRPFEGTSSAELVSSILRDSPPLVTDVRADLPGDLARVIRRCLEKDPRHRVQTARDVSNEFRDLARLVSGTAPAHT